MTDRTYLPDKLLKQMSSVPRPDRPYTLHDLVLSYIAAHPDGANANDLLVYLWESTGKVTVRAYVYQTIFRLRKRGVITTKNSGVPNKARNYITARGAREARPFLEINNE